MMNKVKFKPFKLTDIFDDDIPMGNKFDLIDMSFNDPIVNFVGRSASNNGVSTKVDYVDGVTPFPAGTISLALGGSICSAFLQDEPFYTGQNVAVLTSKFPLTDFQKLYLCTMIYNERGKYQAFGRELNTHLKTFTMPLPIDKHEKPDWNFMESYMNKICAKSIPKIVSDKVEPNKLSNVNSWKEFRIDYLFGCPENCKCGNAGELIDGDDIFYIGAKKTDNGIMKRVAYDKDLVTKGNCIVFICDGQGSVGYSNYMDKDFIGSTTLSVGYNENLNKYNGLFLVSVLDLERPKYSYGRKYRKFLPSTTIKLPPDKSGNPDWAYMESYIKSLPHGDNI